MRKIQLSLDTKSIDYAVKELNEYKKWVTKKTNELRVRVAKLVEDYAQQGFNTSIASDTDKSQRFADVKVECNADGTVVIAKGDDAVFVEFGAGVFHNTSAGTSPHPKGAELNLTIGSYGQGKGKRKAWGYMEDGELIITHGTVATMPMYNAVQEVCRDMNKIAKEVFK